MTDYETVLQQARSLSLEEQARQTEDLDDMLAADLATAEDPVGLPLEDAKAEIERERAALREAS